MDTFSGVKAVLFRHGLALREAMRYDRTEEALNTLLYMGVLGFLIMIALLKWMLLPPSAIHISLTPEFLQRPQDKLVKRVQPSIKSAELPAELKQIRDQVKLPPQSSPKLPVTQVAPGIRIRPIPLPQKSQEKDGYWYWLKPLLICAEIVPFVFFLWHALRAYQIRHFQRDWVMKIMGAHPFDIHALVFYRMIFIGIGAVCIGFGGYAGIGLLNSDVPIIPITFAEIAMAGILVTGIVLSSFACRFPPPASSQPML